MDIAFVRPEAQRNQYIQNVPVNYIHLAAYLREHGHRSHILDMVFRDVTPATIDRYIRDRKISLAGIGCMTCEFPEAVREARRLKSAHPGIKVVFGGAHPSADPEECLKTGVVDYVIVGEGEIALAQFLDALEVGGSPENIPGIWSLEDGVIKPNVPAPVPNIEELPRPAYDLLDLEKYFRLYSAWHFPKSPRNVQFISSRGCPYRCSYCHAIHGKKFRGLSPAKVVDQMEYLAKVQGVKEFIMVDDIFNFDLERAKEVCRGIIDRKLQIHMQFPNGVRGDRFDEELVALMKQAGTHFMAIAIETVSEKFQRLIRKHLNIEKALRTIGWANKHDIEVSGFFMIGFPGETVEEVNQTLEFALNAPLDAIFISIVMPLKGTVMREDILAGRFGAIDSETVEALEQLFPTVHNDSLPLDLLKWMRLRAYVRFYTKPRPILQLSKKMTRWRNVMKLVHAVRHRIVSLRTEYHN